MVVFSKNEVMAFSKTWPGCRYLTKDGVVVFSNGWGGCGGRGEAGRLHGTRGTFNFTTGQIVTRKKGYFVGFKAKGSNCLYK